jgi:hypothetical protein
MIAALGRSELVSQGIADRYSYHLIAALDRSELVSQGTADRNRYYLIAAPGQVRANKPRP